MLWANNQSMTKKQFSDRLKLLRANSNVSQSKLSDEAKITKRVYEYYENENDPRTPTCKNIIKLANYFNCSIDYLFCQTDNPTRNH